MHNIQYYAYAVLAQITYNLRCSKCLQYLFVEINETVPAVEPKEASIMGDVYYCCPSQVNDGILPLKIHSVSEPTGKYYVL